jgi:hypothetical protein
MDNCWSVTQSGGNEISKIGVDWFLAVLETPKKKVGGLCPSPPPLDPPLHAGRLSVGTQNV